MPTKYNIHNLIEVIINDSTNKSLTSSIDFHIAELKTGQDEINTCKYQINIKPYDQFNTSQFDEINKFHLVEGLSGKLLIDKIEKIIYQRNDNGYNIYTDRSFPIQILIQLLLSRENHAIVHAAALTDQDGNGIILPGPGGVGKTALLGKLVKEKNYKLLGDDMVIINKNDTCLSFPRSFILKDYHKTVYPDAFLKLELNSRKKIILPKITSFINKNAPFIGVAKSILKRFGVFNKIATKLPLPKDFLAAVPVSSIFGENSIVTQTKIKSIVFLERYTGSKIISVNMTKASLSKRMFSIIHHELASYMKLLFSLGSLELEDVSMYFSQSKYIMDEFSTNKKISNLQIPYDCTPDELYDYFISEIL